jgi:hypothetical protein
MMRACRFAAPSAFELRPWRQTTLGRRPTLAAPVLFEEETMRKRSPVVALAEGLLAGALGAAVQSLFFASTQKLAPRPPKDAFVPPDPVQRDERETETVARRAVEDLAGRGPLSPDAKQLGGQVVHYAFGAGWGGLYGLARATWPQLASPLGVGAFSLAVWAVGDNVIVPLFRLGAWPQKYPPRTHAYAIAAHLAYGAGVAGAFALVERAPWLAAAALTAIARRRHPIRARWAELQSKVEDWGQSVKRGAAAFSSN